MNNAVHFVVEPGGDIRLAPLIAQHLDGHVVSIGTELPQCPENYRLIVLWNLHRIIRELPTTRNVVVFHSSDLPKGRGWAPIYHALAGNQVDHVITAILAGPEVDAGEVVAKARFRIQPCHIADTLREIDEEVCVMTAAAILRRFDKSVIKSRTQYGETTYNNRRTPSDSEVDISRPFAELIPHIRGCGNEHPAVFDWHGCRYQITLTPDRLPNFPDDLQIEFADAADPT